MRSKYYLAGISAFVIWGLFSIPLKALAAYPAFDILIYRVLFASVVMILINLFLRPKITKKNIEIFQALNSKQKFKLIGINLISAVLLAINWYLFIYVMNNISVNATSLAYMLCPIITTVLASLFLKEILTRIQWLAVILSLGSCIALGIGHLTEVSYSFVIALSYAVYLVIQKNNHRLGRFFTLTFQVVAGTLMILPLAQNLSDVPAKNEFFFLIALLIAVVFTIVPMFLNVFSLNGLNSSTVGIFIYINPILSFLLAVFYFGEQMNSIQIIAYSVVFISVILFNYNIIADLFKHKKPGE
jgi:chloramphenicol-sensitive protein RarD